MNIVYAWWLWVTTHSPIPAITEDGASLVEYALLVALIGVVCLIAISLLGANTSAKFSSVGSSLG